MKRHGIDPQSILIGILFGIIAMMLLGAKGATNGTFDTITVRKIEVTNEEGTEIISLGSSGDGGWVTLRDTEGTPAVKISSDKMAGEISILNRNNPALIFSGHIAGIVACNEEGNGVIGMRSHGGNGQFVILDGKTSDWKVVMQQNLQGGGEIFLYDKNSRLFWSRESPEKQENPLLK